MDIKGRWFWFETCRPYLLLTLNVLFVAVFMILLQYILSKGVVSVLAIVVYENIIATVVLSFFAFFLERQKRPPLSIKIVCYAFLLGFLQVTLSRLMLAMSLQYIASSYQSICLNLIPAIVFVLALIFRQEKLRFCSTNGQAKIWGVTSSAAGVLVTVLWKGPTILKSTNFGSFQVASEGTIGAIMLIVGVLATSFWNISVGPVTRMYPAELSLLAMVNFFGTIQTAIVTAIVIPSSSWELQWLGGLVLLAILFGGIVITAFSYYVLIWSIHKRGPVFTTAFTPLLIVFSFLLDTIFLRDSTHLGSIVGAILVVVGLYLILWAKADDKKKNEIRDDMSIDSPLIQP
ncbi:hypothetical protein NE237_022562 [Protea cynaroides]|uniref:WAT1-related protein n=1 Tax=Protea cynaroides TaxID=273540 RepID=A0A9Q0HAN1_9MAGN|nr:hypothetical protein NE237_022562 [Protea cynaroides]